MDAPIGTVALSERVDPANAPHPVNDSERMIFRQLYETLARVDCNGNVIPGLASTWLQAADTGAWTITLREDARFSDGATVTAADVVASWTVDGDENRLRPAALRLIRSAMAVDDRTIEVSLESQTDTPRALAHRDLAIAKRVAGSPWPLGTRRTVVAPDSGERAAVITLIRLPADLASPGGEDGLTRVRFLIAPGRDVRDLLDEGVDLVLTRDSTALDYAATLPQFVSIPLAWQRTYALAAPFRSREARPLTMEERDALAHDAVRGESRGSQEPSGLQTPAGCVSPNAPPSFEFPALTPRVVYDGNDTVARDLAERLVGLVRASGSGAAAMLDALLPDRPNRSFQRAAGLTGAALAMARRSGNDAAYIITLDRHSLDPCMEIRALTGAMSWVDPQTIVPLVDTRLRAIARRGHSGLTQEWDGALLLGIAEP
ncbi:MAG TPA: ABC transporter substrate-binding protein [Terriglobia bacterium]|nr:ABC transporter substrate-binding protein [Terriglobia bacterium]